MRTVKRLLSYMKYSKFHFIFGFSFLFLAVTADLSAPLIAQRVIDEVITPAAENGEMFVNSLSRLLFIYLLLMLIKSTMF